MKLWKGNRLNGEWELSNKEIATKFLKSSYYKKRYDQYRGTVNALVFFITAKDGLDSTWEYDDKKGSVDGSKDMLEILDIIEKKMEV